MKRAFLTTSACLLIALSACTGRTDKAAGDSSRYDSDTALNPDTMIGSTDTSSIGVDNSGNGGTDALSSPNADSAALKP